MRYWRVVLFVYLLVLPGVWAHALSPATGEARLEKPNILLIMSDDQHAASIACMPNLKRLIAGHGVTFTRAYASTPLCCPGRSSMLTGLYAHNHRIRSNGVYEDHSGAVQFGVEGNEANVVAKFVQAQGYLTGYFGKYLNGNQPLVQRKYVPPYWNEWHTFLDPQFYNFQLLEHGADDPTPKRVCYLSFNQTLAACTNRADRVVRGREHHSDDVLKDQVLRMIDQAVAAGRPFFAVYAPKAPHSPMYPPDRYQTPENKRKGVFTRAALERLAVAGPQCTSLFHQTAPPPSFLEPDVSEKPEWIQALQGTIRARSTHKARQQQIVSSLATDDAIAAIVEKLEAAGLIENTIIIYTTDNGYSWGNHWWRGKNCFYEECARLPLVVRHPQTPAPGSTSQQFIMNLDLAPTIAALAGNPMPSSVPLRDRTVNINGRSFAGLLDGSSTSWDRDEILLEVWGDREGTSIMAAVRDTRWKYIEHYTSIAMAQIKRRRDGRSERELYDLSRDPHELDNLLLLPASVLPGKGYTTKQVNAVARALQTKLQALKAQ
jgi:arylsulfatase A-like enzyme